MSAGYLVGRICYMSADDAADAFYTSASPAVTPGAPSYLGQLSKSGGAWQAVTYRADATGVSEVSRVLLTAPVFPSCDPVASFMDGMTLGWGVVAALAAVTGIKLLRRAL